MKINRLFTLAYILIAVSIITSCSTTSPTEKLLVGTWKTIKAAAYEPNGKTPANSGIKVTDSTGAIKQQPATPSSPEALAEQRKAQQLERAISTQMRTTMTLKANKTAIVTIPGKSIDFKWKLNKKGNVLTLKNLETGKKGELKFVFVNDSAAMAVHSSKAGDMVIRYGKVKEAPNANDK
jgi:hypothetical protein